MKSQYRPSAPPFLLANAKSFVATLLSVACILTLGVDLPLPAAPAPIPAAKDKKQKQDPVLKGLPITELTADEAILHALNRLAYGPRPGDVERVRQQPRLGHGQGQGRGGHRGPGRSPGEQGQRGGQTECGGGVQEEFG